MTHSITRVFAGIAALVVAADISAQNCTPITSVPFVITSPGNYCVVSYITTDLSTGAAIEIRTDNVSLDFANGGLDGLAAGPLTQASGVYAVDRSNITIQNGTIRGFAYGIALENTAGDFANTTGLSVSEMLLELNRAVAIEVRGANTTLTKNLIQTTGNSPYGGSVAINLFGPHPVLYQNNIIDTATQTPDSDAIDIQIIGGSTCDLQGNRMVNTVSTTGQSIGVLIWSSSDCLIRNNIFDNRTAGTPLDIGVYIIDSKRVQTVSNSMTNVVKNYLH
jgi:hypothetical protein